MLTKALEIFTLFPDLPRAKESCEGLRGLTLPFALRFHPKVVARTRHSPFALGLLPANGVFFANQPTAASGA